MLWLRNLDPFNKHVGLVLTYIIRYSWINTIWTQYANTNGHSQLIEKLYYTIMHRVWCESETIFSKTLELLLSILIQWSVLLGYSLQPKALISIWSSLHAFSRHIIPKFAYGHTQTYIRFTTYLNVKLWWYFRTPTHETTINQLQGEIWMHTWMCP